MIRLGLLQRTLLPPISFGSGVGWAWDRGETDTYETVLKVDSDNVLQNTMNLLKTLPFHNPSVRWSTF